MKLNRKEIIIAVAGVLAGLLIYFAVHQLTSTSAGQHTGMAEKQSNQTQIWTCSMHPQIRKNEPGKCPICGMDLIPLASQIDQSTPSPFVHTMSPEAIALANVQTIKASYATPKYEIFLTGKIAVNETKLAVIAANYPGRIEKLFVDFTGETINKGQKMATLYSPDLVTAQKELIEAAKSKEVNPSLYHAVREKLRLWKITEKQLDAIESGGEVVTELDVYADISGIVMSRNVSAGDYVNRGSVLFEIADLTSVWIVLDAYESDLPWVKIGAKVNFTVASIPGQEFSSSVSFVDPLINPRTRTASVRAEADNHGLKLKPEMFVKAEIKESLSLREKSLLIPKTSVLWTGARSVVYVKVPDSEFPSFEMREVFLGPRAGDFYVVESGLLEAEEIVTDGVFAIDAAAQLSGNYSMMNRPISKRMGASDKFKSQLTELAERYFELKNALVKSDYVESKNSAGKVLMSLRSVDMKLLDDKAHNVWMELEKKLKNSINLLSKAVDIEEQRLHFETLSDVMIETAEVLGLTIDIVYVLYCPMAFDNKGAYWLSESDEIKNPYYGEAMLTCGEVKKRISSVDSYKETSTQQKRMEHKH